jgi:prenyltransferase beta subunit
MHKQIIVVSIVLATLLAGLVPVLAVADTDDALEYLRSQQNADGGFGSAFSPDSWPSWPLGVIRVTLTREATRH